MMSLQQQLAQQIRDMHSGSSMTGVNLKDALHNVTWQMATYKIDGFNTIAALTFHINYYIHGVIPVFKGGDLTIHDKFSYDAPEISSEVEWNALLEQFWSDGEELATLIDALPDDTLFAPFVMEKYGTYLRNILGIIEHTHYHLGQIVLLKKHVSASGN